MRSATFIMFVAFATITCCLSEPAKSPVSAEELIWACRDSLTEVLRRVCSYRRQSHEYTDYMRIVLLLRKYGELFISGAISPTLIQFVALLKSKL